MMRRDSQRLEIVWLYSFNQLKWKFIRTFQCIIYRFGTKIRGDISKYEKYNYDLVRLKKIWNNEHQRDYVTKELDLMGLRSYDNMDIGELCYLEG